MATPQTPYDAVLHAARDVTRLDSALDAEMLGAALLGSVYAVAEHDRERAVREFVSGFLAATSRRRSAAATTLRAVFAALVPDAEGAARVRPGAYAPSWAGQLGRVRVTGAWAYGDVYGDQTSYLATFAYDDEEEGGPEHALVALVDHNIGITKDVFVGGPAGRIVEQAREICTEDEFTWFRTEDPARMHAEVSRHLAVTDDLTELPAQGSLATDRALVGARLAVLPGPTPPAGPAVVPPPTDEERTRLVRAFLDSPEAARFGLPEVADGELASLHFCLGLLLDHAASFPDADPMRWSPMVAELFLLDWVHRRAVLDMDDAAMLPRVLRAWAAYAARQRGLSQSAAARTDEAITEMVPEFARLYSTGERRSPATAAVAQLMADGVDPDDPEALNAWIEANRHRLTDDPA
ncbi:MULTISPECIES: hypothetical protein [Micromonospora]|uniref:Uncharacterized protein n=2 Tax=Micromonospora aurantiaca (nom. illeg.) TaxID=47850 RepID=A0A1C6TBY1_9ACTN|nr:MULTISPECIES: hypothetical protein [Micromonospora]ADL43720.1 hypothetical protein Micau_0151 [Micromonospora aurantiaca ATCC 27029]AXH89995.1 hypothetical protein DVH21_08685 [Micromonospora aurantiaca]MBC9002426.1 hypothetical protein [Micromonospora aurantiaca]RNI02495.1 hypothetical protein EEZ25_14045 [Micromonospora aurantiaca]SCL39189.1 hypothetical protein GA0070615_3962 [Micromonospora aurantiaca]